ncbi:MAG: AAA family ATPase [Leptospira bouyouniensis]
MDHKEITQTLKACEENIILIYAFNSTGKTRLSIAYKDETKRDDRTNTGVYYNAFSEDLFVWDNDSDNEGANVRLTVKKSIFNQFHSALSEDLISENLEAYLPKYRFRFNLYKNPEEGIESISFFPKLDEQSSVSIQEKEGALSGEGDEEFAETEETEPPIKISRGEERIFVWCFVLALFEIEEFFKNQSEFIFIDDPVSSMDEHNIFITASIIFEIIEKNFKKRKVIITTHHAGMYSLIRDFLKKGATRNKFHEIFKEGEKEIEKEKFKLYILKRESARELNLLSDTKDVFLYHLKLFQDLDEARENNTVLPYHFAMLRQLLESVSSFLGKGNFSYVLQRIKIENVNRVADKINALSHKKMYSLTSTLLNEDDRKTYDEILTNLESNFGFKY